MMKEELLVNMESNEVEDEDEAGAPEDVQVRSRLGRGNSLLDEEDGARECSYLPAEFPTRPLSTSFRVLLPLNAIVMGLLPALVLAVAPVPKRFEEQGVFWKDQIVILFFAVLGVLFSTLTTLVSIARTKWWNPPCHVCCAPAYSISMFDIQSVEIREPPFLAPPVVQVPPRTTSTRQMCVLVVKNSFPASLFGATYQLWLSPQDPRDLSTVLGRALKERDSCPPPQKKKLKTKAPLPRSQNNNPAASHANAPAPQAAGAASKPAGASAGGSELGAAAGDTGGKSTAAVLGGDWKSIHREVELVKYKLEGSETLEGLALKFDCKVEDIKRINGMATGSLAAFSTLMLPIKPKEVPT